MKLTQTQLRAWRLKTTHAQGFKCAVCDLPLLVEKAQADHDHSTGKLRGCLHAGCNSLEGKVKRAFQMCPSSDLPALLRGLADYLEHHSQDRTGLTYPSHKTPEERKQATKKRALKRKKLTKIR